MEITCKHCGYETETRMTKGTRFSEILCYKCGRKGFRRNTEYDKELMKEVSGESKKENEQK